MKNRNTFTSKHIHPIITRAKYIIPLVVIILFTFNSAHAAAHPHLYKPHLKPTYPSDITWTWHHPDPYRWNVYISLDNGKTYIFVSDYWQWGDARRFAPDGGSEFMYVVGVDASGAEITKHSNSVRPDDARVPKHPK
jgi:hypothetical protein